VVESGEAMIGSLSNNENAKLDFACELIIEGEVLMVRRVPCCTYLLCDVTVTKWCGCPPFHIKRL
jgi:hypothetical protein